jgi:hypothetical protein
MTQFSPPRHLIDDLENRQDEVIRQLDELNAQIEGVLRRELGHRDARLGSPATAANTNSSS